MWIMIRMPICTLLKRALLILIVFYFKNKQMMYIPAGFAHGYPGIAGLCGRLPDLDDLLTDPVCLGLSTRWHFHRRHPSPRDAERHARLGCGLYGSHVHPPRIARQSRPLGLGYDLHGGPRPDLADLLPAAGAHPS